MAASVEEDRKKKTPPQLVKLNSAFKLAEMWVGNMSKSSMDEKPTAVEIEGRPARLGIGATVPKDSNAFARSSDPVERKLQAKLRAVKQENNKRAAEDSVPSVKEDEDSEEDDSESRAKIFTKRPPKPFPASVKKSRR